MLRLVGDGLANKQVARQLGIDERTVEAHLTTMFQRIGVTDPQAALLADGTTSSDPGSGRQVLELRSIVDSYPERPGSGQPIHPHLEEPRERPTPLAALSVTVLLAATPTAAFARHGADDGPGHHRHGNGDRATSAGHGADDGPGHRRHGADDGPATTPTATTTAEPPLRPGPCRC